MSASPAAWVGLAVGMLSIAGTFYNMVFTFADLRSQIHENTKEIARNFKEDEYSRERQVKAIERIDTTISGLTQVHVKIGQMEVQLSNITELLKRMESRMDRSQLGHQMPMQMPLQK